MPVLVEGFDSDAVALARLLASEERVVRLAGPGEEPEDAANLRDLGIRVESHADLDSRPGPAEVAYLDVWTPAVAPRVQRLRAQGTRISCLGDLLLERWPGRSVGITGTAGKTTTTAVVASILRAGGTDLEASAGGRAGNLWPTADLLERLCQGERREGRGSSTGPLLLLELTSSHLAFMHRSPTIAAVVSFWPDHIELHGDLDHYRAAKEAIVRFQGATDTVVVNADDDAARFASVTPAGLAEFSLVHPVARGAYLEPNRNLVLSSGGDDVFVVPGELPAALDTAHPGNVVAAVAIAAAAGVSPAAVAEGLASAAVPPWRAQRQGTLNGVPVIDDGMAATPTKAAATLAAQTAGSVVLIAGGLLDAGGGLVHASPEEQGLFEVACAEIARTARVVVTFGEAGPGLAAHLRALSVAVVEADGLDEAVTVAAGHTKGAGVVVFSPFFPLSLDERVRFAGFVRRSP